MAPPDIPAHIQALQRPEAHPHHVQEVELRQTHISYLLFAGEFVYKLKKPLDFGFLDFSTLEKRRHYCEQEVALNRRLCDETYLGVVAVGLDEDRVAFDGTGSVVDYAVKMRRLPDEGMMTRLVAESSITPSMVEALARRIADFHMAAERSAEIDLVGGLDTVKANWHENFEQTEAYVGRTISRPQFDDTRAFVENVVEGEPELFGKRTSDRRVCDCHGDLRTDAVCFVASGGICIFDCIEFNDRFRYSDVAADIAFLAMDLEFRGRQDLSDVLMTAYLARAQDGDLPLLMPFYKCYRAYVRGKVDGFQIDQAEIADDQRRAAAAAARSYFELAHQYATQSSPHALFITIGVTGSGKSYLANALACRIGGALLSSDITRKRLLGIDSTERHWEPYEQGIYSPEATNETYRALLEEAGAWLERGKPAVIDASFLGRGHREAAVRLAQACGAAFVALECEIDEATILERLSERRGDERVVSDGRWEIYQKQQEQREPTDDLPLGVSVSIDTTGPLRGQVDEAVTQALQALT